MPADTNVLNPAAPQPSASTVAAPQVEAPIESGDLSSMFSAAQATGGEPTTSQPSSATVSAPSASAGSTPTATTVSALAAQAAELGIQLPATASDADVASALMSRYQQMAPMAQYAQSLLPHADAINEFFATRGQVPAQPASPAKPAEWSLDGHFQKHWDGPKLTQEMQFAINQGMVVRDAETGLMVPKPGMEMMVAPILQGLNQAINWQSDAARGFIADPYRKTWDVLQDPIERLVQQKFQSYMQYQQQQFQAAQSQQTAADSVNQFEVANKEWIYQPANNGGMLLTPKGQQFVKLVKDLSANFSGDANVLLSVCKQAVLGAEATGNPAGNSAPAAAAPVAASTPSQVSQQQKSSFLQNALSAAAHQPSGGGNHVQSPSGPSVVSPMELDSMFLNDFRAAAAAA